jgi:RND family efflux transporter MFP subunit
MIANQTAARVNYQSMIDQYNGQKSLLDQQIAMAENNLVTTQKLFEIGAASKLEVDNARLTLEQAQLGRTSALSQLEAGIQSGKSSLEQVNMVLEHVDGEGNVIAPVSGVISTLTAIESSFVTASYPVAVIQGAEQMKIYAGVSESLIPALQVGALADVSVQTAGAAFAAEIRSVDRAPNMQTGLYGVTLSVPEGVTGLMPGMFAEVTFHTDSRENTVVIPSEAILTSNDVQYVFVVENDTAHYTEITTGLTGSGVTEVLSGLKEGQQLVVVGHHYLAEGDAVRIVDGTAGVKTESEDAAVPEESAADSQQAADAPEDSADAPVTEETPAAGEAQDEPVSEE